MRTNQKIRNIPNLYGKIRGVCDIPVLIFLVTEIPKCDQHSRDDGNGNASL